MIDESTEFGRRVAAHLRDGIAVWLTTVTPEGGPLPSPVWFVWDGESSILMHSMPSPRVRNVEANPHVSLNFPGTVEGGDIVVLSGTAVVDTGAPPADRDDAYRAKYDEHIARIGMTPQTFAEQYSVPVRITLTGLRGH